MEIEIWIENYEYEVRFRLKKLMNKFIKCAPNASNGAHLCPKSEDFYPKSEAIYYINVPQSEGGEKKCPIEALVREKAEFRGHSTNFE